MADGKPDVMEDARERRPWSRRIIDAIFGFDFFISYRHADGRRYARKLCEELEKHGFECFLDTSKYRMGDDWKKIGYWTLRRTSCLVLVGSPGALESKPVLREVKIFRGFGKRIVPIDFEGSLDPSLPSPLLAYLPAEILRLHETRNQLGIGPTDPVIKKLRDDFKGVRQDQWRIRVLGIVSILFGVIAAIAIYAGIIASQQRDLANFRTRNVTARLLAAESRSALEQYPQRSVLLAVEALRANHRDEPHVLAAEQALRDALAEMDGLGLVGHNEKVTAVTITSDGRWAVSAGWDGTIRVWDLQAGDYRQQKIVFRHERGQPIEFLEVSDDNQWLYNLYRGRLYRRRFDLTDPLTPPVVFGGNINDVEISPNGNWCVTGGWKTQLWDLQRPDFHKSPIDLKGHDEEVVAVAFSGDGRQVVTADKKGKVLIWNVAATRPAKSLQTLDAAPRLELNSVAFSNDGRWLATGDVDGELRLWSRESETSEWSPVEIEGHRYSLTQLAFTGDSTRLISGGKDNRVRVLTLPNGETEPSTDVLTGHSGFVTSFVIGPEDRWLATTSQDGTIRLWDLQARAPSESARTLVGHDGWVQGIATDPHGRWLITASWDGTARLWEMIPDVKTDYPLAFRCDVGSFKSAALSPRSRYLIAFGELPGSFFGGGDGTIRIWDTVNPARPPARLDGHKSLVRAYAMTSDDALLVTGSSDHAVCIWHREGDQWSTNPITLDLTSMAVMSLAISPNDRWLVTGSMGGMTRLWDLNRRNETGFAQTAIELAQRRGNSVGNCLVDFSADGRWLAVACEETGWVWDMSQIESEGPENIGIRLEHQRAVDQLHFMPDGDGLFTLSGTRIYHWTLPSPSKAPNPEPFSEWINDLLITHDGRWLVASSRDYPPELRLWHADAEAFGDPLHVLRGHGREATSMSANRDNTLLATSGGFDRTVRVWSLDGSPPDQRYVLYLGEEGYAHRSLFSPNGRLLFASENELVRCWDLQREDPTEDSILFRASYHVGGAAAIDDDSHWLVTSGMDAVRLWTLDGDELLQIARRVVGRNLTLTEWQAVFRNVPYRRTFDALPDHRDVIRDKIQKAREAIQNGEEEKAEKLYREVVAWGIHQDDVWLCNEVSADGCEDSFAHIVLAASEHAVELVPDNRTLRRRRGIARGMTGDLKGALKDLRSHLDNYFDEDRQEMEQWIKKLERGHELTTDDL